MGSPQDIKNRVKENAQNLQPQTQEGQLPIAPPKKELTFNQMIEQKVETILPSLTKLLGERFDPHRFARIIVGEVRKTPKLQECSMISILGAATQAATLRLEPGLMGYCYLLPFWNKHANGGKGGFEAQFQLGYQGYMELAKRTGLISTIEAEIVYEGDEFHFEYGSNKRLYHKPNIESEHYGDKAHAKYYYCMIKYKDGSEQFKVITKKQAVQHGMKYSKSVDKKLKSLTGTWLVEFDAMALKTAIKMLMKTVQLSTDFQRSISLDETVTRTDDLERSQPVYEFVDAEYAEVG